MLTYPLTLTALLAGSATAIPRSTKQELISVMRSRSLDQRDDSISVGAAGQHQLTSQGTGRALRSKAGGGKYEVWGSDQSNSVAGEGSAGVKGSFLWIWDSESIKAQLAGGADATPLSCTPGIDVGPCDLLDIFPPGELKEVGTDTALEDLSSFGRLHGVLKDPSNRYVTVNIFTPGGGYVGVMDTETKEAIALFRVTQTTGRSVHMSFWSEDGSAIIVDNLNGKMVERIDVTRDKNGKITDLVFNKSAGVFFGKDFNVVASATAFEGTNAFSNALIGSVVGTYDDAGKYYLPLSTHSTVLYITGLDHYLYLSLSITRLCII
jgi:hypothetical protein